METVTVELRNSNALRLLKDLELANILRIIENGKENVKPSKSLSGSISKKTAEELSKQIDQSRREWDKRGI